MCHRFVTFETGRRDEARQAVDAYVKGMYALDQGGHLLYHTVQEGLQNERTPLQAVENAAEELFFTVCLIVNPAKGERREGGTAVNK